MKPGPYTLLLLVACQSGPATPPEAVDPQVYSAAQNPEGRAAWERAQARLARGDRAAALPDLLETMTRSPDFVRAHLAYQDAARELGGAAQQAMLAYYHALPERDSPVPAYCKARLAETSFARGTALRALVVRYPSFAWARLSLGRVNRRKGELLQAVDLFKAAFVIDPSLHEARLERAQVLAEVGRDEESAVDYEAYLGSSPQDDAARHAYAQLAIYRLGRIERAIELLDQLEKTRGSDLSVRMDRAAAQWLAGDARAAIQTYLQVLEAQPREARALLNIGLLYYEVLPKSPEDQQVYWPKARVAFQMFLDTSVPQDGHEQFERTLAVPYRLDVISGTLGAAKRQVPPSLDELRMPDSR